MSKKKTLSYKSAYSELQAISSQLESDDVDIDELTSLVKRAKELVKFCQDKLRATEKELSDSAESED